jgi:hypothetical protein
VMRRNLTAVTVETYGEYSDVRGVLTQLRS